MTDSAGRVVEYAEYTDGGQRKTVKVLAGTAEEKIISYGYDTKKRLETISLTGIPGDIRFTYDTLGRRQTLSYPNGVVATYTYHPEQPNWLTGISYAKADTTIYKVSYPDVDMVGNRKAKSEGGQSVGYINDDLYRLLTVTGSQVEAFTYDAAGNRLTEAGEAYTIGAGNQVTSAKGESYSYDDLGNITRAGERIYTWNDAGELIRAQGSTADVSFKYDATGRRIQKAAASGATRDYLYDAEDIAVEYIDGVPTLYLHGPGIDEPLAMLRGGQAYFFHADGLGSVVRITDTAGAVVKSITYSSFGKVVTEASSLDQPYGFTGRERDTETGLNYHRARYYDPEVGRWLSRDALGFAGGDVVLYGYVGQNPVNSTDPSGLVENFLPQIPGFSDRFPSSRIAATADIVSGGIELGGAMVGGVAAGISYLAGPEFWPISVAATGVSIEAAWDGVNRVYSGVTKLGELSDNKIWSYQFKKHRKGNDSSEKRGVKCQ